MKTDYTDFFDFQDVAPKVLDVVRTDFGDLLTSHLTAMDVATHRITEIVRILWHDMTGPLRHYHSPVHLLGMFASAQIVGMSLPDSDRLAIWFHDSLYNPAAPRGKNESDSAEYLKHIMSETAVTPQTIEQAAETVRWTAQHLHDDVPREHHRVLDLDLWGFSSTVESFAIQSSAVRKEFPGTSDAQFALGTSHLFRGILARKSIYRTPEFAPREALARQQLERELTRLMAIAHQQ